MRRLREVATGRVFETDQDIDAAEMVFHPKEPGRFEFAPDAPLTAATPVAAQPEASTAPTADPGAGAPSASAPSATGPTSTEPAPSEVSPAAPESPPTEV